jgi:hypothetical protein
MGLAVGIIGMFESWGYIYGTGYEQDPPSASTRLVIIISGLASVGLFIFGCALLVPPFLAALPGGATASTPPDDHDKMLAIISSLVLIVIYVVSWMTYDPHDRRRNKY